MENDKEMQNAECTLSQSERHNEEDRKKITESNALAAKPISKWAMVFSAIIIISLNVFVIIKLLRIPTPQEQQSILLLGFGLLGIFSPVYISIWLDKIFGGKK